MSVVTRNTFWLYAGDFPYIDLKVKGVQTFMIVYHTLELLTPTEEHYLWPGGPEVAAEDGMDTRIRPWEFFLLVDGGRGEIRCTHPGSCSDADAEFHVYSREQDTQIGVSLTNAEAEEVKKAVEKMVEEHRDSFVPGESGIYKPAYLVPRYQAKSLRFVNTGEVYVPEEEYKKRHAPRWPRGEEGMD